MCGIAVILPGSALTATPFAIDQMTRALAHRGPDDVSAVRFPRCHLGHTRLSIIDPAHGQQPMSDPSNRYTVVFNGEIYNHRELRRELERCGHAFQTRCDTEVLLHACIEWGEQAPSRLRGQFAFALWDNREHTLFVARDRFGEKPLFWAQTPAGDVVIASEIKAILASDLIEPLVDRTSVDAYLGLLYVPPDRTIYENVHTIRPAHAAKWEADGMLHQWRYWSVPFGRHAHVGEQEAVKQVRSLLERAVASQTVADVPVGAFLSGGLDSSTIVALMSSGRRSPVQTFAVGFGDLINELPFASEVAQQYRTDHHALQTDIDVAEMLERMTAVYDEPFADSSNIPTYLVSGYARRHVKVVLSGDGGDEIFGGYDWYRPLLQADSQSLRINSWFGPAGSSASSDIFERHLAGSTGLMGTRTSIWGAETVRAASELFDEFSPRGPVGTIDAATHFDVDCYLAGDILVKVDRAAMAHGLETRAPFLDVDLAEFVLGLPWKLRFKDGTLKHLLRAACGQLWPESVRTRGKQGFGAPVRAWLERPAVRQMWKQSIRPDGPLCALLPGLRSLGTETMRPQGRWTLLCLGLWLESRTSCLAHLS